MGLLTPFGMTHSLYVMSCLGSYLGSRPETLANLLWQLDNLLVNGVNMTSKTAVAHT